MFTEKNRYLNIHYAPLMMSQKESPRKHHGFENLTTALIDGGNSAISGGEMSVTCFPRIYKVLFMGLKFLLAWENSKPSMKIRTASALFWNYLGILFTQRQIWPYLFSQDYIFYMPSGMSMIYWGMNINVDENVRSAVSRLHSIKLCMLDI